jgi:hypothetical protein
MDRHALAFLAFICPRLILPMPTSRRARNVERRRKARKGQSCTSGGLRRSISKFNQH